MGLQVKKIVPQLKPEVFLGQKSPKALPRAIINLEQHHSDEAPYLTCTCSKEMPPLSCTSHKGASGQSM